MRMKGIVLAALAAGVLFVAPGVGGAHADQFRRDWRNHQQSYDGRGQAYGWWGQQTFGDRRDRGYAYGNRARNYDRGYAYGNRAHNQYGELTRRDRERLSNIRRRYDNEWAFRRFLQHHKPGLFKRYSAQPRHQFGSNKFYYPQRYGW